MSKRAEIIWCRIARAHGTNNGQEITAVLTTRIPRVAAIICLRNSHPDKIHSTALFPITIRLGRAIDRKRRALSPGFKKRIRVPLFLLAKIDGSPSAKGNRTVYAQWEDAGPFRTDHWQYVFGNERPKPNLNKGAGLDVSPAVRDYLGLKETDVTDWKFVDFKEVPRGPWSTHGENNTFVINDRKKGKALAEKLPPKMFAR